MESFFLDYLMPFALLGTLAGFLLYLYLCNHIHGNLQDSHPQWLNEYLGAMDSNIGVEFRALHVVPPLLRSRQVAEIPSLRLQRLCRFTRYLGWFWMACLVTLFLPLFIKVLLVKI
ncbi:hypothetical protein [Chitinilyticum aquatile]|uniref:hypothetical protein n=1 Tax=Chitinilyticum aquatile TaxID=362520 RepID=UPI000427FAA2|nr:hypothetical protein [Chitinilyticum aquatile]